ncbi:ABC transporter permease [Oceanispirochaeta crateris]|uniref:ABC transporter permease n=1 Tax=Oceanispirochaeta crateris TaxID=2518645 RepID=A0A5C1QJC9_9SPIO|nr:ABC transporter permease [Oceanispirochaeta crateris]QEN07587.1 ABC transporter permease [Oceanispirochaeta crateris]
MKKKMTDSPLGLTLISVFLGLLVGALILLIIGYNPIEAYKVILMGIFSSPRYISWTVIYATPIILTGLSVAFAFKTGLFNIGAEGQFIIGALTAALAGYYVPMPALLHIPFVLLCSLTAGALWGGIAGYLKARYGVNEVISTIMLNWIALYLNNYIVLNDKIKRPGSEATNKILDSAKIIFFDTWKKSSEGIEFRKAHPFWGDIFRTPANAGFLIAILAALIIWIILKKTTLGYSLKAVGFNKDAAEFGGINIKASMINSMAIAGALSGLAGAVQIMGFTREASALSAMEGFGFEGISVSLIGAVHPIGCVLSGLLYGALKYGGSKIQPAIGAPYEIINIIMGTIVLFISMPKLIRMMKLKKQKERI